MGEELVNEAPESPSFRPGWGGGRQGGHVTGTSHRAKTLRRQRAGPVPSCVSEAGMDGGLALVGCGEGGRSRVSSRLPWGVVGGL